MNASTPKFLSEGVRLVSMCPVCKEDTSTDVHILTFDSKEGLVHVTCKQCGQALMAHVERGAYGVRCVGIVTDLSLTDAHKMMRQSKVAVDDVLATHEALTSGALLASVLKPRCS